MKNLSILIATALLISTSAFTILNSIDWKVPTDNYTIKFSSADPTGIFKGLTGTIKFDEKDLENSKFDITIAVNTINTGNPMKNTHAVSPKWFDAVKYPNITFVSSKISATDKGFETTGTLTIKAASKEITFPFTFESNTFKAKFDIDRTEYDMGPNRPDGHASKVLSMELEIPVTK